MRRPAKGSSGSARCWINGLAVTYIERELGDEEAELGVVSVVEYSGQRCSKTSRTSENSRRDGAEGHRVDGELSSISCSLCPQLF